MTDHMHEKVVSKTVFGPGENAALNLPSFEMPVFFCPLDHVQHPLVKEMEKHGIEWIDEAGIAPTGASRQRLIDTEAALLFGGITPNGLPDRQRWFTRYAYWGWALDDFYTDAGQASSRTAAFVRLSGCLARMMEAPRHPVPEDVMLAAGTKVAAQFRDFCTPAQYRRWMDTQRAMLFGMANQIAIGEQQDMPDVNEYFTQRFTSSGLPATFACIEVVNGIEIPSGLLDTPRLQALTEMSALVISLDNDVISYRLEATEMTNPQNIVNVVARHHHLTVAEAVPEAMRLRDSIMCRFLELSGPGLTPQHPGIAAYIASLRSTIRSNIEWGLPCPRYARHNPGPIRPDYVTDQPPAHEAGPLPYPSVAWWWSELR
jgi:Terpene synthase family 2, C-terminal metal binding